MYCAIYILYENGTIGRVLKKYRIGCNNIQYTLHADTARCSQHDTV